MAFRQTQTCARCVRATGRGPWVAVALAAALAAPAERAAAQAQIVVFRSGAESRSPPPQPTYRVIRLEDLTPQPGETRHGVTVIAGASGEGDACRRDAACAVLRDPTLQRGDLVMTPAGFVAFVGEEGGAHAAGDFAPLARVALSGPARAQLRAMEQASLAPGRPALKDWFAGGARVARAGDDGIRLVVWRPGRD